MTVEGEKVTTVGQSRCPFADARACGGAELMERLALTTFGEKEHQTEAAGLLSVPRRELLRRRAVWHLVSRGECHVEDYVGRRDRYRAHCRC